MANGRKAKKTPLRIEAVAALLLLVTMAALTVLLISATGGGYSHIVRSGAAAQEMRTGLLFVTTRVRQADAVGTGAGGNIRVQASPFGGSALVIASETDGTSYEDWIFSYKGTLREVLVPKGAEINPSACTVISRLSSVRFALAGRELTVAASGGGQAGDRSLTLTLRS